MSVAEQPFTVIFGQALQHGSCAVVGLGKEPLRLPVEQWRHPADQDDRSLLDLCEGSSLDIGCGPGRLTAALTEAGHFVLGIDVVHEAVGQTRRRGVCALRRDVFDRVPGEGRWQTALLADGNIGIGGNPVALLRRLSELLTPGGRVVVEVEPSGTPIWVGRAVLLCDGAQSRPFRWSVVGLDQIHTIAATAGLDLVSAHAHGERRSVVLRSRR